MGHARLAAAAAASLLGLAVAACGGDDGSALPDGAPLPDGGDGDGGADCYRERDDRDNGVEVEATALGFAGDRLAICGAIDGGHASGDLVDVDRFALAVTPGGPMVIRLMAPLGSQLDTIDLALEDAAAADVPVGLGRFRAGHAVTVLTVPAGDYVVRVESRGQLGSGQVPYRIEIYADDPAQRCAETTGSPTHTELDESGAGHRANDVVEVRFAPALTAALTAADDAPDGTGEAVSAGGRMSIAGLSAEVASAGDDYRDRDTYVFYTGATTNQIDVRATWDGDDNDLDLLVFEADGGAAAPLGTPRVGSDGEVTVTAVKPSTQYWLWVGGAQGSASLPARYAVYVCGREIAPATSAQ